MGKGVTVLLGRQYAGNRPGKCAEKSHSPKTELENLINESLKGKDPHKLQDEMVEEYEASVADRLKLEETETNAKYEELIRNIPMKRKYKKILAKQAKEPGGRRSQKGEKRTDRARDLQLQNLQDLFKTASGTWKRHSGFLYQPQYPLPH